MFTPNPEKKKLVFSLEEEPNIPDCVSNDEIDEVKKLVYSANEYELIETETRNVLFLGKTRSGKSTAVSVLKNPCHSPDNFSIFSETVEAKFQSFSIKDNTQKSDNHVVKKYTINVIDTPGLFEVKALDSDMEARTNDSIIKTISKCLENEITKLNAVVMFASFTSGVDKNDVEAIAMFAKLFGKQQSSTRNGLRIALCVTRADNKPQQWRDDIVQQLQKHPELAPIINENKFEVLFMGCVESKSGAYFNQKHLLNGYRSVYTMRKKLLEFIFESTEQQKLLDLDLMYQKKNQISELIDLLIGDFKEFKTVKDWTMQNTEQRMIVHKENSRYLAEAESYTSATDLAPRFAALIAAAREFYTSETIPKQIREDMVWPLKV